MRLKIWLAYKLRTSLGTAEILQRIQELCTQNAALSENVRAWTEAGRNSSPKVLPQGIDMLSGKSGELASQSNEINLADLVSRIIDQSGDDGIVRCLINRHRLLMPTGLLRMYGHCLHPTDQEPLQYLVETAHADWICEKLLPGDVFIDIGASGGLFSAAAAKLVRPSGTVVAFEPANRGFELLRKTVISNGFTNIRIAKEAVSDYVGFTDFLEYKIQDQAKWLPETSTIVSREDQVDESVATIYMVPVTTLDHYFADSPERSKIKSIKIDVEVSSARSYSVPEQLSRPRNPFCVSIYIRIHMATEQLRAFARTP